MPFRQQLVLLIIDKFIIAAVIAVVGFYLKRSLDDRSAAFNAQQNLMLQIRREQQEMTLELQKQRQALAKELRDLQTQKQLQVSQQIAAARLPAYQRMWEVQESTAESLGEEFTPELREELVRRLRAAYFQNGNGILLTPAGVEWYRTVIHRLKISESTSKDIRDAFTGFRRQLKIDVAVYTAQEATQPTDPKPLNSTSVEKV
jgi:hypothetical protein